jgi:hypothetical protein
MKQGYKYTHTEIRLLHENWKKFAKDNIGKSKTIKVLSWANKSDLWLRKFKLEIPFLNGQIIFSTNEFKPLKITFEFHNQLPHKFLMYPEDYTDRIGKYFGLKEIEVNDIDFDSNFFIKADEFEFINTLLSPELKTYLTSNYVANFKLDEKNDLSFLELNIVINELEYSEMDELLVLIKKVIKTIIDFKE